MYSRSTWYAYVSIFKEYKGLQNRTLAQRGENQAPGRESKGKAKWMTTRSVGAPRAALGGVRCQTFYFALFSSPPQQTTNGIDDSLCVLCFLLIHSGHQVRWTYQPGSHRRKVTQDFSSTFFLRCVPSFFSREGFSHSFPSSTVKSNFVYSRFNRSPPVGPFYFYFFVFL